MNEPLVLKLWRNDAITSSLAYYPRPDGVVRPAMLVIPGGGYGAVCEASEGHPIAERFEALGFQTFVLKYRVAPNRYPAPQLDAFRAIRMIRLHAEEWGVDPQHLAVCGFSAGAHLAASCGILFRDLDARDGDSADQMNQRPDALVLGYSVISFVDFAHRGSAKNLLGDNLVRYQDMLSLEKRVSADTPPAFLWHTVTDQIVPYENSLLFAKAMWRMKLPCELHVFPEGPHGMQLGYGRSDISQWPEQAKAFLQLNAHFRFKESLPVRKVVLTFDDAVKNHLSYVAPLLQKYQFHATFFPCRFSDDWRSKNSAYLMDGAELKQLHDMGFEIGNHTWSHPDMRTLSPEDAAVEIDRFNEYLTDAGIPLPRSFAYPGGPYAENIVPLLKERGFRCARTTEQRPWNMADDDPFRLPCYPIAQNNRLGFYSALSQSRPENAVVFVFHGIPDVVHPWCDNAPDIFLGFLEYLAVNGFQVCSLRDLLPC